MQSSQMNWNIVFLKNEMHWFLHKLILTTDEMYSTIYGNENLEIMIL